MRNDKYVKTIIVHDGNPSNIPRLLVSIDVEGVINHPEIYGEEVCKAFKILRALKNDFFDLKTAFLLAGNDLDLLTIPNEAYRMIKKGFGKTLADTAKYQGPEEFHSKLTEKVYQLVDHLYSPIHPDKNVLAQNLCQAVELFPDELTAEDISKQTNFTFKEALFIKDFLARD